MSHRALIAAALALTAIAGCGGERTFEPDEFVAEINTHGAELVLGPVLMTRDDGVDVHVLESSTEGETQLSGESGAATMLVLGDSGAAEDEFERCETAPVLTCFRVANVVLRFEEMDPAERARIVGAVEPMGSG